MAGAFSKALAANGKPEVYGPLFETCNKVLFWLQTKEKDAAQVG